MKNLEKKLQILNENKGENSLFDYVTTASENDSNFYRWLFDEDFENDFDKSLTESQKREFQNWLSEIELEDKFENYIVVSINNSDEYACITKRDNFETVNLCDCFGNHGQKCSCYDSGCYSIDNSSCDAKSDLIFFLSDRFTDIDFNDFDFDNIEDEYLKSVVAQWRKDQEVHTEVTAWTYWDGNNHKTLCLATDFGNPDCEELDEEESKQILKEFTGSVYVESGASASEKCDNYTFTTTLWASDPWICSVEKN